MISNTLNGLTSVYSYIVFFKGKRDDNPFYTKEDAATEARQIHAVSGFMFVIFL